MNVGVFDGSSKSGRAGLLDHAYAEQLEDDPAAAARDPPDEGVRREGQIVVRQVLVDEGDLLRPCPRLHACPAEGIHSPAGERLVEREPEAIVEVAEAGDGDLETQAMPRVRQVVDRVARDADMDAGQAVRSGRRPEHVRRHDDEPEREADDHGDEQREQSHGRQSARSPPRDEWHVGPVPP